MRASGRGRRARAAAHRVIERFGYLQLDTVSIAGARSHALVLCSRLDGFAPAFAEELLQPGEPLFEYWGHEACWLPLELYPLFEFRRQDYRRHPWWGDLLTRQQAMARDVLRRIADEGPLRSLDLGPSSSSGWWQLKAVKKVTLALWSAGELAIRERRAFQRSFDLSERVIPAMYRRHSLPIEESLRSLLLRALAGHGWATTGTLAATWRLRNLRQEVATALAELVDAGEVSPCAVADGKSAKLGWIRPGDLDLAARLERVRPRRDRGVLLSPFDPVLWDRARVAQLFGFEQVLEIYKPAPERRYGYYCLPVLAGDRLVARVDLKAERGQGRLRVLSCTLEDGAGAREKRAVESALVRYASAVELRVEGLDFLEIHGDR